MIIDSHCHAWEYWPYEPPVPDPESRGRIEQLINQMDLNGVQQATIVSAQIEHNPSNNDYIAESSPCEFATARSRCPSSLKSALSMATGACPTG